MTTREKQQRRNLNARQRRFVLAYIDTGNATEAARRAGYAVGSANVIGPRLTKHPVIAEAIGKVEKKTRRSEIATARERQEWWTKAMRGEIKDLTPERLRAAELLGKAHGDFITRSETLVGHVRGLHWKDLVRQPEEGSTGIERRDVKRIEAPPIDVKPGDAMPTAQPATEASVAPEVPAPRPTSPAQLKVAGRDALSDASASADRRAKDLETTLAKLGL